MARGYQIAVCTGCRTALGGSCTCEGGVTARPVTVVDLRDVEPLVEALREAVDMVADWAGYASPYFQEKWDLDGDLAKLRAALQPFDALDPKEKQT